MPDLNYIDGSSGTMKVGTVEYSVESWNAKLEAGMNAYTASKNGGWAVHRRSFKKMTGSATILYETDVPCYSAGPIPGNIVTLTLVAANTSNFTGNFVIGEADFKWDPSGVAKIDISFGNSGAITGLPS